MTVNLSSNYQVYQKPGYSKKWTRSTNSTSFTGSVQKTEYVSQYDNICTDGNNDGKIGLFDKIGCFFKGIGQTVVNMVKGAIQNPLKTALMIGASFIPVVGPVVMAGLAAYGIYNGATTLINGIQVANSATDDAQAKDAWENIGVGGSTAAVSAFALKGATGALRNQLSGGSTTVNSIRTKLNSGEKVNISDVIKEAAKETKTNLQNVATKVSKKFEEIKEEGVSKYLGDKAKSLSDKAKNLYKKAKTKHSKESKAAAKEANAAKAEAKKAQNNATEETIKQLKEQGAKKSGFGYKKTEGNTTIKYNSKGEMIEKTVVDDYQTVTTTYKNGKPAKTTTELKLSGKGKMVTEETSSNDITFTTRKTYDCAKGKLIKTSKYTNDPLYHSESNIHELPSSSFSRLQKMDTAYRASNYGLGDNVQFGKLTTPITRTQAYNIGRFTTPALYNDED